MSSISISDATRLAKSVFPTWVEHRGCVLRAEGIGRDNFAKWWDATGGDCRRIESGMNHLHLCDLLPGTGEEDGARWTALLPGLTAVIHVLLLDPVFGSPTGTRLDSPEGAELVACALAEHLPAALAGHPGLVEELRARL